MLDDSGTFAGSAAREIQEETGLIIPEGDLVDLTALAHDSLRRLAGDYYSGERLQNAVYPSPGGSDEFIPLFLCQKRMPRNEINEMQGRLTGLRKEGEKITLRIVPLEQLWIEGLRDGKALAALALYQGLKREGRV
jgi:ADP-sugar diphosphatase